MNGKGEHGRRIGRTFLYVKIKSICGSLKHKKKIRTQISSEGRMCSDFRALAEVPGDETSNEWLEAVDNTVYFKATGKEV